MFCGNNGWGGNSALWIIILIIILFGWGGNGCGCNNNCGCGNNDCGCGGDDCGCCLAGSTHLWGQAGDTISRLSSCVQKDSPAPSVSRTSTLASCGSVGTRS